MQSSFHIHGDTGACNGPWLFKNIKWVDYILICDEKRCFEGYDDIFEYGYSYFFLWLDSLLECFQLYGHKNLYVKMNMIYSMLEDKLYN